jgi:cbb3-type cytochrome oxidase subunit 3
MTIVHVNGADIMEVIHVVRIVGTIVMMLVVALVLAWAIRKPRHLRDRREAPESDAADDEALWRIVDRMEERLEVLERALADQVDPPRAREPRQDGIFASADEGRDSGRTK